MQATPATNATAAPAAPKSAPYVYATDKKYARSDCPFCDKSCASHHLLKHLLRYHADALFDATTVHGLHNVRQLHSRSGSGGTWHQAIRLELPVDDPDEDTLYCCLHCTSGCKEPTNADRHFKKATCRAGHKQVVDGLQQRYPLPPTGTATATGSATAEMSAQQGVQLAQQCTHVLMNVARARQTEINQLLWRIFHYNRTSLKLSFTGSPSLGNFFSSLAGNPTLTCKLVTTCKYPTFRERKKGSQATCDVNQYRSRLCIDQVASLSRRVTSSYKFASNKQVTPSLGEIFHSQPCRSTTHLLMYHNWGDAGG